MVNTIFILDKTYNTTQILVGDKSSQRMFWDDLYTQEFDTGAETFEFSCYLDENVVEGNYVAFYYNNQYKLFSIMDMEQTHKNGRLVANCYCEIASLALLNNYVRPFNGDMNCIQFFEHILNGTDWYIGKYSTSLRDRVETIKVTKIESVWSLIEDYKDIYECEINVRVTYENGHVTGQFIDIYSDGGLGSSTLKRFEYGRNVTGITKKKELYDWCTGVILDVDCDVSDTIIEERDGYGFTKGAGDIILNDNANRMYNAGRNHVIGVYEGDETEPVEACINAWKQLKERSTPRFDYEVTTALTEDEYEEVHLGDTVYVVDRSYTPPLFLEARVGKLELSFTDRTQNKCVLTNYKEIKSKLLDADYIKLTGTITDVVNAFFPITSEGIADGAIVDGKIETTYFQQITADIVSAGIGVFEDLYAQGMTVINADIENLRADTAEITQLKSQLAEIDTLINGHLTSDNIQSLILTSDKVTVEDVFIKDAMIDTISANKINTGVINTNNVQIQSEDGSMLLQGNLQQFKDSSGKVRIQIGKDANGDFTFCLFSQDGVGVLLDEEGIHSGAIGDGLIVNSMVSDNANIQGGKLDINSVITSINNGTTTINSNRIYLDEEGQSLKVAFEQLKTKVETIEDVTVDGDLSSVIEQVTSNTANIKIMQGEISSLISNTTITKQNGEVVQLKDEYNSTKNTVDSHTTKIGYLETTVDDVTSKQASMELDLSGFKTAVSNTYATKNELTGEVNVLETEMSEIRQTADKINLVVSSNSSSSSLTLTDEAFTVISNNIQITPDKVLIADYTNFATAINDTVVTGSSGGQTKVLEVCNIAGQTKNQDVTISNNLYNVNGGEKFRISARVKCVESTGEIRLTSCWRDSSGGLLSTASSTFTISSSNTWVTIEDIITIPTMPQDASYFNWKIMTPSTSKRFYIEGLSLTKMINGTLIVDGAIDGKTITGSTIVGGAIRGSSNFYTAPNSSATEGYAFRIYSSGDLYSGGLVNVSDISSPNSKFCSIYPDGYIHASNYINPGNGVKTSGQSLWLGIRDVELGTSSNFNIELTQQSDRNVYFRPGYNGQAILGHPAFMWNTVYSVNGTSSSSDRTMKENIKYLNTSENARATQSDITEEDLYNFVRDDLITAQYNFIGEDKTHIGFIAQDLLYNLDGSDNIIGQMIVNKSNDEQSPLTYNEKIYINVLAGALRKAIHKIETLEKQIQQLQENINIGEE